MGKKSPNTEDNSCLFNAVGFAVEGRLDLAVALRGLVAQAIEADVFLREVDRGVPRWVCRLVCRCVGLCGWLVLFFRLVGVFLCFFFGGGGRFGAVGEFRLGWVGLGWNTPFLRRRSL